jgi:hypothetical protein
MKGRINYERLQIAPTQKSESFRMGYHLSSFNSKNKRPLHDNAIQQRLERSLNMIKKLTFNFELK